MKRIYPFFSIFLCVVFSVTNSQAQCPTANDVLYEEFTSSNYASFQFEIGTAEDNPECTDAIFDSSRFPATITVGTNTLTRAAVWDFSSANECFVVYYDATSSLTLAQLETEVNNNMPTISPFVLLDNTDCGSVTLPVELRSFELTAEKGVIRLQWSTASEINNKGFEVQRSKDGKNFKTLDFISGAGTTIEPQFYTFTDEAAQEGVEYFYRLKQFDFDETFDYSKVLVGSLKVDHLQVSNVFPNPATDAAQINVTVPQDEQLTLELFDNTGKLLRTQQQQVGAGVQTLELDVDGLAAGLHVVKLQTNRKSVYRKVVVR